MTNVINPQGFRANPFYFTFTDIRKKIDCCSFSVRLTFVCLTFIHLERFFLKSAEQPNDPV